MDLGSEPLWELQYLPGSGGRVRRIVVTRRGLRRIAAALVLAALLILAILGVLPVGLHGIFARFSVDTVRRENRQLRSEGEIVVERAAAVAAQTDGLLKRAKRLAWVVGARGQALSAVEDPPVAGGGDAALASWLEARLPEVDALAETLARPGAAPPCPLAALPTGPPVAAGRAVPVSVFGWRVSPFTGKREAHHGVTLAAPEGEAVLATGDGRIAYAGASRERRANEWSPFGNLVVVDHGGGVYSLYGHLKELAVKRGQAVSRGGRLGRVGQSGWTRVPALYFEVRWPLQGGSRPVDPALFVLSLPVADLAGLLADPTAGLPADFAVLGHIGVR
ncbi:MAG: M23 family metallopeptidase [Acidobacteriota bacterium]